MFKLLKIALLITFVIATFSACSQSNSTGEDGDAGVNDGSADAGDTKADMPLDGGADLSADATNDAGSDADEECYENIDIVFVLDVSTSMSLFLQKLEEEIGVVWSFAEGLDDDPHFGLVVFVDDVTVASSQSYLTVEDIQADFNTWYTHTSTNQQTQSSTRNMDYPENTLDALMAAAEQFEWRDINETLRVIIHATDDGFFAFPESFASGIPVEHTYYEVVDALRERQIRVACFAARFGGMGDQVNVEMGYFSRYGAYESIPEETSGAVYEIDQILDGQLSLTAAINDYVISEFCSPYQ